MRLGVRVRYEMTFGGEALPAQGIEVTEDKDKFRAKAELRMMDPFWDSTGFDLEAHFVELARILVEEDGSEERTILAAEMAADMIPTFDLSADTTSIEFADRTEIELRRPVLTDFVGYFDPHVLAVGLAADAGIEATAEAYVPAFTYPPLDLGGYPTLPTEEIILTQAGYPGGPRDHPIAAALLDYLNDSGITYTVAAGDGSGLVTLNPEEYLYADEPGPIYPSLPASAIFINEANYPGGPMDHPVFAGIVDWINANNNTYQAGGSPVDVETYLYADEPGAGIGLAPGNPGPWDRAAIESFSGAFTFTVTRERYVIEPTGELRRETLVDRSGDGAPPTSPAIFNRSAFLAPPTSEPGNPGPWDADSIESDGVSNVVFERYVIGTDGTLRRETSIDGAELLHFNRSAFVDPPSMVVIPDGWVQREITVARARSVGEEIQSLRDEIGFEMFMDRINGSIHFGTSTDLPVLALSVRSNLTPQVTTRPGAGKYSVAIVTGTDDAVGRVEVPQPITRVRRGRAQSSDISALNRVALTLLNESGDQEPTYEVTLRPGITVIDLAIPGEVTDQVPEIRQLVDVDVYAMAQDTLEAIPHLANSRTFGRVIKSRTLMIDSNGREVIRLAIGNGPDSIEDALDSLLSRIG